MLKPIKKLVIILILLIGIIWVNISIFLHFTPIATSKNKLFTEVKTILSYLDWIYFIEAYPISKSKILIYVSHDLADSRYDYFIYDIKTKIMIKYNDKITKTNPKIINLAPGKFIVRMEKEDETYKFVLYDFNKKEIKYFKGYTPKDIHNVLQIDESNFIAVDFLGRRLESKYRNMYGYIICNTDSMTCKFIKKHKEDTVGFTGSFPDILNIGDGKLLMTYVFGDTEMTKAFLYDIKKEKFQRLNNFHFTPKVSKFPNKAQVYKKNHIYLLRQTQEIGTEIMLYELKDNKLIKTGNYVCKDISKKVVWSISFPLDEKNIIIIGGSYFYTPNYFRDVYVFNTETKKFTRIDTLPSDVELFGVTKINNEKVILTGDGNNNGKLLIFNKERLYK